MSKYPAIKKVLFYILDTFFPPNDDQLILREVSSLAHLARVRDVETDRGYTVTALMEFQSKTVRAAVHEAKFFANRKAQRMLGEMLKEYLFECGEEQWDLRDIVIMPMPLSGARFRARGYNQVTEIVRQAMRDSDFIRLENRILKRIKNSKPQTSLDKKERIQNVKGIFGIRRDALLLPDKNTRYILLDDVVTTGSTMHEAAKVLEGKFGIQVDCVALAH